MSEHAETVCECPTTCALHPTTDNLELDRMLYGDDQEPTTGTTDYVVWMTVAVIVPANDDTEVHQRAREALEAVSQGQTLPPGITFDIEDEEPSEIGTIDADGTISC